MANGARLARPRSKTVRLCAGSHRNGSRPIGSTRSLGLAIGRLLSTLQSGSATDANAPGRIQGVRPARAFNPSRIVPSFLCANSRGFMLAPCVPFAIVPTPIIRTHFEADSRRKRIRFVRVPAIAVFVAPDAGRRRAAPKHGIPHRYHCGKRDLSQSFQADPRFVNDAKGRAKRPEELRGSAHPAERQESDPLPFCAF
jgi:hypothetical protein